MLVDDDGSSRLSSSKSMSNDYSSIISALGLGLVGGSVGFGTRDGSAWKRGYRRRGRVQKVVESGIGGSVVIALGGEVDLAIIVGGVNVVLFRLIQI